MAFQTWLCNVTCENVRRRTIWLDWFKESCLTQICRIICQWVISQWKKSYLIFVLRSHSCSEENTFVRHFKRESVTLHVKESCHMEIRHITYECIMWMPVVRSRTSSWVQSRGNVSRPLWMRRIICTRVILLMNMTRRRVISQWMNHTTCCIGHISDSMTCFDT